MKYNLVLAAVVVGMLLCLPAITPIGVRAQVSTPRQFNVIVTSGHSNITIGPNGTLPFVFSNSTVVYNLIGSGGNDSFRFSFANLTLAPSAAFRVLASGVAGNNFTLYTGNVSASFSFSSGDHSNFTIYMGNYGNATQSLAISGGANSFVGMNSTGFLPSGGFAPINGTVILSVSLGANSSISIGSAFVGNDTIINLLT